VVRYPEARDHLRAIPGACDNAIEGANACQDNGGAWFEADDPAGPVWLIHFDIVGELDPKGAFGRVVEHEIASAWALQ
jgi:hypothetical protein